MAPITHNPKQTILQQYSTALVVGLGVTGYSVVRYLKSHGLKVSVMDSRTAPPMIAKLQANYPDVECFFGGNADHQNLSCRLVIASPGVGLKTPIMRRLKQDGAYIAGDIELFVEANDKPIIAITGSNGKSTVTTLVGHMCGSAGMQPLVAGNIGLPALDALTDQKKYDIAVLELSSFQLETTARLNADSAAILNISADHMDRYESMGDYVLAKARVLRGSKQVILPRHDDRLKQISYEGKVFSFDLDEPANDSEFGIRRESNYRWLMKGSERLLRITEIPLIGLHNVKNVLAALALVDFLKLPVARLVSAVRSFHGLPHRMQTVVVSNDVAWVNDSKATNVGATSTALRNLEKDIVWIAGGQGKGADFTELRDAIRENIKLLILFGQDADKIESALEGLLPISRVDDMAVAVKQAAEFAQKNSMVLLSPACASFDMYKNFEQRGDDFSDQVHSLIEREAV